MLILAVCGSLQKKSGNRTLLEVAQATAPEEIVVRLFDGVRDLPHFDPDIEATGAAPEAVLAWRAAVASSDALLIASAEYGHSLPGALKNAIDWLIGSGELEGKLVAVAAAVPIEERGQRGLRALCDTLAAVSAQIVGGQPIARGPDFEPRIRELVRATAEAHRARC